MTSGLFCAKVLQHRILISSHWLGDFDLSGGTGRMSAAGRRERTMDQPVFGVWEIFPKLTEVIRLAHVEYEMGATGHDFGQHTFAVAQVALIIAENEIVGRIAAAAGTCHNADRMLQKRLGVGKRDIPEKHVISLIRGWLEESGEISDADEKKIVRAVLLHSEPNLEDGDEVLVALQDADRVVCSMAENVMTTAQFWTELPAIDPRWLGHDPAAHSYKDPRSVLKHLECRYDWIDPASRVCVRLPKARALLERRVRFLQAYIAEVEDQRAEIGLWPYPLGS